MKVTGTPTVFVNGRRIPCCPPSAYFDALIDIELKKAK
jgi:protein-disulfide isomerase